MKEITLEINGKEYTVKIEEFGSEEAVIKVNGKTFKVGLKDLGEEVITETVTPVIQQASHGTDSAPAAPVKKSAPASAGNGQVLAPLPGLILNVMVKAGDKVQDGQRIMVMEAMKMENDINATATGVIKELHVKNGDNISEGEVLAVIE